MKETKILELGMAGKLFMTVALKGKVGDVMLPFNHIWE